MTCAVGICAAVERVRWEPWDETVTMAPRSYASAVQAAGALALLLPPDEAAVESPDALLDRVDALILAGGADVGAWPERDRFEIALARRAIERELPLLGICRGMQVLNVALGGSLVEHLPDVLGHDDHRHTPGAFGDHEVVLEPGSLAARAAGGERMRVKSHHHQGVDDLGAGLVATGWSVPDDVVEAIEQPDRRFALGVLWHPEEEARSHVIGTLTEATGAEVRAR
jgi:putative glutamine amidotransferase